MPSKNTTAQKPKPATVTAIRTASTPRQWRRVDSKIEAAVGILCGEYDAEECNALAYLVDLISNRENEQSFRDGAAFSILRAIFRYTPECESAQQLYMQERRKEVRAAS